ncbi:hypothetical protein [Dryocola clanedunensis]
MSTNLVRDGDFETTGSSAWNMTAINEGGVKKESETVTNQYCQIFPSESTYQDIGLGINQSFMLTFKYRGIIGGTVHIFNSNSNESVEIIKSLSPQENWTDMNVQFTVDYDYSAYRLHFQAAYSELTDETLDIDEVSVVEVTQD